MNKWLIGRDWWLGLKLLSLDLTRCVYDELGVEIQFQETLRGLSRDILVGRPSAPRETISAFSDYLAFYDEQVPRLREIVLKAFGQVPLHKLDHWISDIACLEDHNQWVAYEGIISSWASHYRRFGIDRIGFAGMAGEIQHRYDTLANLDDIQAELRAQYQKPLSEWDEHLFSGAGLYEIPPGSDFLPYLDQIDLTIGMRRFLQFWEWLESVSTEEDIEKVRDLVRGNPGQPPLPPASGVARH